MTVNDTRRHLWGLLRVPGSGRFRPGHRVPAQRRRRRGWPETPYGQGIHPFTMAGIMR